MCNGRFALFGYLKDEGLRYSRIDRALNGDEIDRVCGWINLLRIMRYETTPDVVAIYLIATCQTQFLFPTISANLELTSYPDKLLNGFGMNRSGFGSKYPQYAHCCCCGYSASHGATSANKFYFPVELYKMARRYQLNRISEFAGVILDTVRGFRGMMTTGLKIDRRTFNALQGFEPVGESINDVIRQVKALHASLIPTVSLSDKYCYDPIKEMKKHPSLRWDLSVASAGSKNSEDEKEFVTPSVVRGFFSLNSCVNHLFERLRTLISDDSLNEMGMDIKEAFCLGCEMILYVTAMTQSGYSSSLRGFHIPEIDNMNKLVFSERIDPQGSLYKSCGCANAAEETRKEKLFCFRHLSPQAAICVGDLMCEELRHGWRNVDESMNFDQLFRKINPKPFGEVLTFLLNEWHYQRSMVRFCNDEISQRKRKGGQINV